MEIELRKITVRELTGGYTDSGDDGVAAYGGRLDVRPPYQREFVYGEKQRDAVIDTVSKDFPLNVMYWADREDDSYEIIDGQQRTVSLCQYVNGDFSVQVGSFPHKRAFHNLTDDEQRRILDYPLMVYVCRGSDVERLEWFRTINIAGEKLTEQELRNAVFAGSMVSDAKRYFSKTSGPAYGVGGKYLSGSAIRQDYLETAIRWISGDDIEGYMAAHQHDPNAGALWRYFRGVIEWVQTTFTVYRKEMKGLDWGLYYNRFHDNVYDTAALEREVKRLMMDDDVTTKRGIYPYLLTGEEKHLSIRRFSESQKREVYERQKGICAHCGRWFDISQTEADHITPWHSGGKTSVDNCQILCVECNRKKSGK